MNVYFGTDPTQGNDLWIKIIETASVASTAAADLVNFNEEVDKKIPLVDIMNSFHFHFDLLVELTENLPGFAGNAAIINAHAWLQSVMPADNIRGYYLAGVLAYKEYLLSLMATGIIPERWVIGYGFS